MRIVYDIEKCGIMLLGLVLLGVGVVLLTAFRCFPQDLGISFVVLGLLTLLCSLLKPVERYVEIYNSKESSKLNNIQLSEVQNGKSK